MTHNVSRQGGRVGEGLSASSSSGSDTAALVSHDPRTARLREEHEVMDYLHWQLLSVLLDPHWEHGVPAAVDVALLGRFHERFADHAVEVGTGLSSWSPARCPGGGRRRLLNGGHLDGHPAHGDLVRCVARNVAPPGICQRRWTLRQGGWISGRGGCSTVQPRRQHRPPA